MKKRFLISLLLLLILSTYSIQENFSFEKKFAIEKIIIENNVIIKKSKIKDKLSYLYEKNLFFLRLNPIKTKLNQIDFINSFEIKKIYPNTIKIKVFEEEPIAIIQNKKKKKYYTASGKTINYIKLDKFDNIPTVFGDANNFHKFFLNLKNVNFPIDEIKRFYFFESKRWDLVTIQNQIIKLPIDDYNQSLKNFLYLRGESGFKKYKTFDYRINNQLILK